MSQYIDDAKKTWEVFAVGMGFAQNMEDGETISMANSSVDVVEKYSGEDVTNDLLQGEPTVQDGNMLVAVLRGGESGVKYTIRFKAHISDSKKLQEDLLFVVQD